MFGTALVHTNALSGAKYAMPSLPSRQTSDDGALPVCALDKAVTNSTSDKKAAMPTCPALLAISAAVLPGVPSKVWDRQLGSAPLDRRAATQAS